ncbi:hypothetical protein CsSME_00051737 [Camellia sinensis var. sinensis]
MSSSSIDGGEGQMLRFMSKKCRCGKKASIRIVESEKPSKGTLYYVYEKAGLGSCDFWAWWNLVRYAPIYRRDETDDEKPRVEEGVHFNGRLVKLEMKIEALNMMMKTSMVVLLVCFISTMLMFTVIETACPLTLAFRPAFTPVLPTLTADALISPLPLPSIVISGPLPRPLDAFPPWVGSFVGCSNMGY